MRWALGVVVTGALWAVMLPLNASTHTEGGERLAAMEPEQRRAAIAAFGRTKDTRAVPALIRLVEKRTTDPLDRMDAIYALGLIGDDRAVPVLMATLERDLSEREGFAMAAIPALGWLGDRKAVPLLRRALNKRNDHWLGREVAAIALGDLKARDAVPDLIAAAWMADTRAAAIQALAAIVDDRAVEVLFSALFDDDPTTISVAEQGLIAIGPATVAFIAGQMDKSSDDLLDSAYRQRAVRVLNSIGTDAAIATASRIAP